DRVAAERRRAHERADAARRIDGPAAEAEIEHQTKRPRQVAAHLDVRREARGAGLTERERAAAELEAERRARAIDGTMREAAQAPALVVLDDRVGCGLGLLGRERAERDDVLAAARVMEVERLIGRHLRLAGEPHALARGENHRRDGGPDEDDDDERGELVAAAPAAARQGEAASR